MTTRAPATVGMRLEEVDTPALILDLDAFEANLKRLADAVRGRVRVRAHAKTHKCPDIGKRQVAAGAVGLCCQKVSEAEVMIAGGIPDVLVSNEVVGARKLGRLTALARQARVMVAVDNELAVEALADAASRAGVTLRTLVEIDVGSGRCGVSPGEPAVRLAARVAREKHLTFAGLQAYQGRAQHLRTPAERQTAIGAAIDMVGHTVRLLAKAGLDCEVVGGAGTGTFELEAQSGVYNELQPGSYIFMDADYARNLGPDGQAVDTFRHALFVSASVMSLPSSDRAVLDAGLKALAFDTGMPEPVGFDGAVYQRPSDEHGTLNLQQSNARPQLGDKKLLIPGHCDPTVNLHDWYVGIRGLHTAAARVETVWPVAARGALF